MFKIIKIGIHYVLYGELDWYKLSFIGFETHIRITALLFNFFVRFLKIRFVPSAQKCSNFNLTLLKICHRFSLIGYK